MSNRETHLSELFLEWAYRRPYASLLAEARATGACAELDLQQLGWRLLHDAARLYRGEISAIHLPARLPRPDEHAPPGPG